MKHKLQERDSKHIWHPCSQMKDYETFKPIPIKKGHGVYLEDFDGNTYIDAVSSWWVNLFGHCNPRINDALKKQVDTLEHVIFANFTHEPAVELSERIVSVTPEGLNKVFFADNGSSAIEVALKLSYQYHQQTGNPDKKKLVSITNAYHGETIGALSVGKCDLYTATYKSIMLDTFTATGPDCYRCPHGKERETCQAECFEDMERIVKDHHGEIAGIVIEPMVQCAAGMMMYSPVYLKKLREVCTAYNIHFIADEIAVGFGRTGKMFACEHADVSPDMMTVSKGLTAGYLPLALTLVTDQIYNAFYDDYETLKAFLHSHSYTGNPLACAVAVETLKIFEDQPVLEENEKKAAYIREKALSTFASLPWFGEFRQLGMIGAIELVEDQESKIGFDWKERVGYQIYQKALEQGVLLRPLGNILYFMFPYVITEDQIDQVFDVAKSCTLAYFKERK